jgi:hypothetical protein
MRRFHVLEPDPFEIFTDRLNLLGVRYMVTGSIASLFYGEPRFTLDVDIVLELSVSGAEPLCGLFPAEEFYCPPVESMRTEILRPERGHFNLIHHNSGFKADIYLRGRNELHRWALDHAIKSTIDNHDVWFAPPEYVIVRKLEYYREGHSQKHLRDIRSMLAISGPQLKHDVLLQKIADLGLESEWNLVKPAAGSDVGE